MHSDFDLWLSMQRSYESKSFWCLLSAIIIGLGTVGAFIEGEYMPRIYRVLFVAATLILVVCHKQCESSAKACEERIKEHLNKR